jgi:hypothetical protein
MDRGAGGEKDKKSYLKYKTEENMNIQKLKF